MAPNGILKKHFERFWLNQLEGYQDHQSIFINAHEERVTTEHLVNKVMPSGALQLEILRSFAKDHNASVHDVLLAAFTIVYSRFSQVDDIVIMSPISSGPCECHYYRLSVKEGTGSSLIKSVAIQSAKFLSFSDFSIEDLLLKKASVLPFDSSILKKISFATSDDDRAYSFNSDISFVWRLQANELSIVFREGTVNEDGLSHFVRAYQVVVNSLINSPIASIEDIELLTQREKEQIIQLSHGTKNDLSGNSLLTLIEQQARAFPNKMAIVCEKYRLTYQAFLVRVNQLAQYLWNKGLRPQNRVAVCLTRSGRSVEAMFAIWKCGGIYVPMDPGNPTERLTWLIGDILPQFLLIETQTTHAFTAADESFTSIVYEQIQWDESLTDVPASNSLFTQDAYIIYTSGSTGFPKGIMQTHEMLANLVDWQRKFTSIGVETSFLQYASFTFDVSIQDFCYVLSTGGTLHIAGEELRHNFNALNQYVIENEIDSIYLPFTAFTNYVGLNSLASLLKTSLRNIITGGEQVLLGNNAQALLSARPTLKIYNQYGPSETHVVTNFEIVQSDRKISHYSPIGRPITNTTIYILDEQFRIVPIGVSGQLFIGGDGLANGYWNQPELTASKFITLEIESGKPETFYTSGDIGKWLPDGNIQFDGRADDQVKVRGYRVELGEIQSLLLRHPRVTDLIAVLTADQTGDRHIAVYYTSIDGNDIDDLKDFGSRKLPDYMIPSFCIKIKSFPLTANGKVNKRMLPDPWLQAKQYPRLLPQTDLEQAVAQMWCHVLGLKEIGLDDQFFQIGGYSLKAIKLLSGLSKIVKVKLELSDIFTFNTIRKLCNHIQQLPSSSALAMNHVADQENYPISNGQLHLWIIHQVQAKNSAYNVAMAFKIKGPLNAKRLQTAFNFLVDRHEILRTIILDSNEGPRQQVMPQGRNYTPMEIHDVRTSGNPDDLIRKISNNDVQHQFDLATDPLYKNSLVQISDSSFIFFITLHHIVTDGWSIELMFKEMLSYYDKLGKGEATVEPEPLAFQYRDYAVWEEAFLQSDQANVYRDYWKNKLKAPLPSISLNNRVIGTVQPLRGNTINRPLLTDVSTQLMNIVSHTGSTVFMTTLSLLKILLFKYNGERDNIIGIPGTFRMREELEEQIGYYVNFLPVRSELDPFENYISFDRRVRENALEAFQFQHYPIGQLLTELYPGQGTIANSLFNIVLNYHNLDEQAALKSADLEIELYEQEITSSKFNLTFTFIEHRGLLSLAIEYNSDLFDTNFVNSLHDNFCKLIKKISRNYQCRIGEVELLDARDRDEILQRSQNESPNLQVRSINEAFAACVKLNPSTLALRCGEFELTYQDLDIASTGLAVQLHQRYGVQKGDTVVICTGKNQHMIIGVLAVLKLGAVYVPISVDFPLERINYMIKDTNAKLVLSDRSAESLSSHAPVCELKNLPWTEDFLPAMHILGDDVACIMYTSGSGGVPKGVLVSHQGIVGLVCNNNFTDFSVGDQVLQVSNFAFDGSTFDIFGALLNGACLHLVSPEIILSPDHFKAYVMEHQPTVTLLPTGLFNSLIDTVPEALAIFRKIYTGGEAASVYHIEKANQMLPHTAIINAYGPTECTTIATFYPINDHRITGDKVPIGTPITNVYCYILDEFLQLQPQGVAGELYIGGNGLSIGYLNDPGLTSKKFIPNPFRVGEKIYRTGDYAYWSAANQIEFLGRQDNQVKIRGYRIECEEIENAIVRAGAGHCAVVAVNEPHSKEKYLVAYLVGASDEMLASTERTLKKMLPFYMVPAAFISLPKFELNANGKIDRKYLQERPIKRSRSNVVLPSTGDQIGLAAIWANLLHVEQIGMHDNFFELGGNSLTAIRAISEMNKISAEPFKYTDLYNYPTLDKLARRGQRQDVKNEIEEFNL